MIHHIRHRLHRHTISFKHAIEGVIWAIRTQPNYIIHFTLGTLAVVFGFIYAITDFEWMIIIMLFAVGLAIETINSSIEQVLDCISLDRRNDIKIAKDASAAAVLFFSIGAAVIATLIFTRYIF